MQINQLGADCGPPLTCARYRAEPRDCARLSTALRVASHPVIVQYANDRPACLCIGALGPSILICRESREMTRLRLCTAALGQAVGGSDHDDGKAIDRGEGTCEMPATSRFAVGSSRKARRSRNRQVGSDPAVGDHSNQARDWAGRRRLPTAVPCLPE